MTINRIKLFAIALFAFPIFALAVFYASGVNAVSQTNQNNSNSQGDTAASYKSKCAACHTAKAEKWFEPSKMDDVLVEIVLKGKKAEKPPHMPAFEGKMTKDQATLLVAYMRQMRTPAK